MILFLAFFLLASGNMCRRKIVKIAGPSLEKKKITVQILDEIDHQIAWFLLVQVFTSIVVGIATWLAFRWFGLNQAAVWGILAGVLNSIPYLGPVVVTSGTAVVAFIQFGDFRMAALVALVALVITTLEGFLLTPWLTSRAARMNAVAVFVGLLFWGVWNVWGMLLALPMRWSSRPSATASRTSRPSGDSRRGRRVWSRPSSLPGAPDQRRDRQPFFEQRLPRIACLGDPRGILHRSPRSDSALDLHPRHRRRHARFGPGRTE
jgi:hypothetical protein